MGNGKSRINEKHCSTVSFASEKDLERVISTPNCNNERNDGKYRSDTDYKRLAEMCCKTSCSKSSTKRIKDFDDLIPKIEKPPPARAACECKFSSLHALGIAEQFEEVQTLFKEKERAKAGEMPKRRNSGSTNQQKTCCECAKVLRRLEKRNGMQKIPKSTNAEGRGGVGGECQCCMCNGRIDKISQAQALADVINEYCCRERKRAMEVLRKNRSGKKTRRCCMCNSRIEEYADNNETDEADSDHDSNSDSEEDDSCCCKQFKEYRQGTDKCCKCLPTEKGDENEGQEADDENDDDDDDEDETAMSAQKSRGPSKGNDQAHAKGCTCCDCKKLKSATEDGDDGEEGEQEDISVDDVELEVQEDKSAKRRKNSATALSRRNIAPQGERGNDRNRTQNRINKIERTKTEVIQESEVYARKRDESDDPHVQGCRCCECTKLAVESDSSEEQIPKRLSNTKANKSNNLRKQATQSSRSSKTAVTTTTREEYKSRREVRNPAAQRPSITESPNARRGQRTSVTEFPSRRGQRSSSTEVPSKRGKRASITEVSSRRGQRASSTEVPTRREHTPIRNENPRQRQRSSSTEVPGGQRSSIGEIGLSRERTPTRSPNPRQAQAKPIDYAYMPSQERKHPSDCKCCVCDKPETDELSGSIYIDDVDEAGDAEIEVEIEEEDECRQSCCCFKRKRPSADGGDLPTRGKHDGKRQRRTSCCSCRKSKESSKSKESKELQKKRRSTNDQRSRSPSGGRSSRAQSRQREGSSSATRRKDAKRTEKECQTECTCKKSKRVPLTKCCTCTQGGSEAASAKARAEDKKRRVLAEELANRIQKRAEMQVALQKRLQEQMKSKQKAKPCCCCCFEPPSCCYPPIPCCETTCCPQPTPCSFQSKPYCFPPNCCEPPACCCYEPPLPYSQGCPCCCQTMPFCYTASCSYTKPGSKPSG